MTGGPGGAGDRPCSGRRPVVLGERHRRVRRESDRAQLVAQLLRGQEALRRPENWVKTNGSPATGAVSGREGVAREGEDEERGARCGDAGRLAERLAKLRRRARQVPDAVRDDQVAARVGERNPVHAGEREGQALATGRRSSPARCR